MQTILRHLFFRLALLLGLAGAAMADEKPASPPPSAEVQAVIEKLWTLSLPETISFLNTVDPKAFAEALQTPEGRWAMDLACRWSTPLPDTQTEAGKAALRESVEKLSREFALVPRAVLDPLAYWRMTGCPEFSSLPDDQQDQILHTQDAFRSGAFLAQLTPVQQEAVNELHDLSISDLRRDPELAESRREYYALFTEWGPEKLHQVLEAPWSAAEFLKAFGELFFILEGEQWKLSSMPSWFWQEIVRFTEGPNAYPALHLLAMSSMMLGSSYVNATSGLVILSRSLKDKRMSEAMKAINRRFDAEYAEASKAAGD